MTEKEPTFESAEKEMIMNDKVRLATLLLADPVYFLRHVREYFVAHQDISYEHDIPEMHNKITTPVGAAVNSFLDILLYIEKQKLPIQNELLLKFMAEQEGKDEDAADIICPTFIHLLHQAGYDYEEIREWIGEDAADLEADERMDIRRMLNILNTEYEK